uniref:Piezo-type mechanosensitive ion channel component 2-like n=1 Tax=Sinocyclocheilus grahami TaxID=75366 RepID=A0A672LET4_SINGR
CVVCPSICVCVVWQRYPQPRGQKKKKVVKYGMGGMIVMLLICIVWFPLLFMSLIKSVAGVVNTPLDVSVTLTLGGLQPIFTMSAQQNHLKNVSPAECLCLLQNAMQFLESYVYEDLTIAKLEGSSNSLWTISPPSKENLIKMLSNTDEKFPLTFTWSIQRYCRVQHLTSIQTIKCIFPRYIRAPSDSNAKPIEQLYLGNTPPSTYEEYMSITLSLHKSSKDSTEGVQEWWIVNQTEAGPLSVGSDHGSVHVGGSGYREVRARVLQRDLTHHHVRRAAQRGPDPQALHRHLPGPRDGGTGPGGRPVRQTHLPLPLSRNHDQVDQREE